MRRNQKRFVSKTQQNGCERLVVRAQSTDEKSYFSKIALQKQKDRDQIGQRFFVCFALLLNYVFSSALGFLQNYNGVVFLMGS